MKYICNKEELIKAVNVVGRLSTIRSTLPILQNIYLEVDDKTLKLRSTDLEQTIETTVAGSANEKGKVTVPARLLTDYLQNTAGESVTLTTSDTVLVLESKDHKAKIKGLAAEEYPNLPVIKADKSLVIPSNKVKDALTKALFAAATDDSRPILNGLLWRFKGQVLDIVATDGYRLAYSSIDVKTEINNDYVIPKRSLQELLRLLEGEQLEVVFAGTQVRFIVDNIQFTTRVLDGKFPDYEAIVPKKDSITIKVSSPLLNQSLKLASLFSRDSAFSTKLELVKNKMVITAVSPHLGESSNEVALGGEVGQPFSISVNAQYLIDVLSVVSSDVALSFIDANSPVIVRADNNKDYLYLLMPLRSD